ncbi:hypothetical protein IQ63_39620 [Streptomyces acidiscabies]|uniref:Uncharacterized protein n=1 Tax=Streptomyces acidiscabies TaxID=42234 RepID=A0A0L0JKC5_9ACTN|nr:hypothetical protein IQ63_39620 [Streptomyces acidiscabies]
MGLGAQPWARRVDAARRGEEHDAGGGAEGADRLADGDDQRQGLHDVGLRLVRRGDREAAPGGDDDRVDTPGEDGRQLLSAVAPHEPQRVPPAQRVRIGTPDHGDVPPPVHGPEGERAPQESGAYDGDPRE